MPNNTASAQSASRGVNDKTLQIGNTSGCNNKGLNMNDNFHPVFGLLVCYSVIVLVVSVGREKRQGAGI